MEMQEAIKAWEELEIKDDFMFAKVMRDKKLCKKLLERLLQTKIRDIVYLEEQKSINIEKDAKSIRLDVYIEDGTGSLIWRCRRQIRGICRREAVTIKE